MKILAIVGLLLWFGYIAVFAAPVSAGQIPLHKSVNLTPLKDSGVVEEMYGDRATYCGLYFAVPPGPITDTVDVLFDGQDLAALNVYVFGSLERNKFTDITLLEELPSPYMVYKGPTSPEDPTPA